MQTVHKSPLFVGVSHLRLTEATSGLSTIQEIARTSATGDTEKYIEKFESAGLVAPPPSETAWPEFFMPSEILESPDLARFIHDGMQLWRTLHQTLGEGAGRITLLHTEVRRPVDEHVTSSGLILPGNEVEVPTVFERYCGTPDEMAALESMVMDLNVSFNLGEPETHQRI